MGAWWWSYADMRLFRSPSWYLTSPTGRWGQNCPHRRAWTPIAAFALSSLQKVVEEPGGDKKELEVDYNSDLDYLFMMIIWILCLVELFEIQIAIVVRVQAAGRINNKGRRKNTYHVGIWIRNHDFLGTASKLWLKDENPLEDDLHDGVSHKLFKLVPIYPTTWVLRSETWKSSIGWEEST